jgi:hypothetical protein
VKSLLNLNKVTITTGWYDSKKEAGNIWRGFVDGMFLNILDRQNFGVLKGLIQMAGHNSFYGIRWIWNLYNLRARKGKLYCQYKENKMIALFITLYLFGFIGMAGFIILIMAIAAMFGTLPSSDIWKAFGFASVWPIMIAWGLVNVVVVGIKTKDKVV